MCRFNQINRRALGVQITPSMHHHAFGGHFIHRLCLCGSVAALPQPHLARIAAAGALALVPRRAHPHAVLIAPGNVAFAQREVKTIGHHAATVQIKFQRIRRIATACAQIEQHPLRCQYAMRHAFQIHIVAQHGIKIGHRKQNFPFRQPGTITGGAAHPVHAFGVFCALVEMVHACAVFLAKGNLLLVLQHGGNIVAQRRKRRHAETRLGFGISGGGKLLGGRLS